MGKEDFDKNPEEHADGRNLEELLEEVESVLERLEQGDISLEESFALYEQGIRGLKLCNDKIDFVEKKMAVINSEGNLEKF
ncbi:MAG: exodeoxyribonuclease VII small subunit [Eubacterium sp.]|nr:exodeoxyribonuclease VII small subunit [Eubacterium sp.]